MFQFTFRTCLIYLFVLLCGLHATEGDSVDSTPSNLPPQYKNWTVLSANDYYISKISESIIPQLDQMSKLELLTIFPKNPFQSLGSFPLSQSIEKILSGKGLGLREQRIIFALSQTTDKALKRSIISGAQFLINVLTDRLQKDNTTEKNFLENLRKIVNKKDATYFNELYDKVLNQDESHILKAVEKDAQQLTPKQQKNSEENAGTEESASQKKGSRKRKKKSEEDAGTEESASQKEESRKKRKTSATTSTSETQNTRELNIPDTQSLDSSSQTTTTITPAVPLDRQPIGQTLGIPHEANSPQSTPSINEPSFSTEETQLINFFVQYPYYNPTILCSKFRDGNPDSEYNEEDVKDLYTRLKLMAPDSGVILWNNVFDFAFKKQKADTDPKELITRFILNKNTIVSGLEERLTICTELHNSMGRNTQIPNLYQQILEMNIEILQWKILGKKKGFQLPRDEQNQSQPNATKTSDLQTIAEMPEIRNAFLLSPYHHPDILCLKIREVNPQATYDVQDVRDFYQNLGLMDPASGDTKWNQVFDYWFANQSNKKEHENLIERLNKESRQLIIKRENRLAMYKALCANTMRHCSGNPILVQAAKDVLELEKWRNLGREKGFTKPTP